MFSGVSRDNSSPGRCTMAWRSWPISELTLKVIEPLLAGSEILKLGPKITAPRLAALHEVGEERGSAGCPVAVDPVRSTCAMLAAYEEFDRGRGVPFRWEPGVTSEAVASTISQAVLGEGLRWDARRDEVLAVDILAGRVYRGRVADDGALILKFWLHLSKEEEAARGPERRFSSRRTISKKPSSATGSALWSRAS